MPRMEQIDEMRLTTKIVKSLPEMLKLMNFLSVARSPASEAGVPLVKPSLSPLSSAKEKNLAVFVSR